MTIFIANNFFNYIRLKRLSFIQWGNVVISRINLKHNGIQLNYYALRKDESIA